MTSVGTLLDREETTGSGLARTGSGGSSSGRRDWMKEAEMVPELVETKDRVWGVHDDDINGRAVVTYIVMYVRAHARL